MNRLAGSNPAPSAICRFGRAGIRRGKGAIAAAARLAILTLAGLVAGCHGSTLDSVYPGSLGHTPPPAVNLPPQDCPAPPAGAWPRCLPRPPQSS